MSRWLFSFMGGHGHFVPLLPVARAAQSAGHTIAFACGPTLRATVEAAGFTVLVLGTETPAVPERSPLRPLDLERELDEFRDRFVLAASRRKAPLLIEQAAAWAPDVIVCDEADFGSRLAAERLGLACASVNVMAAGSFVRTERIADALNTVRAELGLPPDPELEMLSRHLVLSPFAPGFRDPGYPLPATAFSFRPFDPTRRVSPAPSWAGQRPGAPLIYFSLGTVFNVESGDLFGRALAGLRDLDANVLVTVGHEIDPAEFGQQLDHVRIERYVPQDTILPHCSLVVSHGGSGSVAGALAHGVPMLLIPMGADQPLNAERCAALGIGRWLDPMAATPAEVADAAGAILADPAYVRAIRVLRREFAALPGPEQAVTRVAALLA